MSAPLVYASSSERGFSLLEVLVSMAIMLLVLTGTMTVMADAMRSQATAREMLDTNSTLRASMDLLERDLLQVGQGLPVGRRIGIPNGEGARPIVRPGPAESGDCPGVDTFPADSTLPAITVGPELGPAINGTCTDVITILAGDNLFGPVRVTSIANNGTSIVIDDDVDISDSPDLLGDNLHPGDLLMLTKGSTSVLMQVTAVENQLVTFGTGSDVDPLGLNQFDTGLDMLGTINQLRAQAPSGASGVEATRIRMITYYVSDDPDNPRLMRVVGGEDPNVVGFGVQAFRLSYDITDQVSNPTGVRMVAADIAGTGACDDSATTDPEPCSENQIRKVNVVLSMRAQETGDDWRYRGNHSQTTLFSQVSLRSMAFVDRYR